MGFSPRARMHEVTKAREREARTGALRALLLVQLQADRVDTVALPGRLRSIGEKVTEVSIAFPAQHFGSTHVEAVIHFRTHTLV